MKRHVWPSYIQACNDAHIALSQAKGLDSQDTYEIVIGGWADSQSVIRDCKQCQNKDVNRHRSLLFLLFYSYRQMTPESERFNNIPHCFK